VESDHRSRKLAVILHADVIGSTALVRKDETLAHQRIQSAFKNFSAIIVSYGGVAREIRGDALVAEFARASDAVTAALAFQQTNEKKISMLADEIRPELRIGISLGEVIIADNTITGAGVVLAQRLEQLCEPHGVVVQGSVSETVPDRLPFDFDSIGEQSLKGFDRPVRAFSVTLRADAELPRAEHDAKSRAEDSDDGSKSAGLSAESYEALTGERFELPDKPSIAVLPFLCMSDDPEQEFFADGIAEDIITSLSRVPELVVISRTSSFLYKGSAKDVRQIGTELAVGHVLEGSVRKVGNRVRITAQLIETRGGDHLWADRYDRSLDDIFAIQDEITRNIVIELTAKLVSGDLVRKMAVGTSSIEAWECVGRAGSMIGIIKQSENEEARKLCERALEIDASYAAAWVILGMTYWMSSTRKVGAEREALMQKAFEYAERGRDANPDYHMTYTLLGHIYMSRGDTEKALAMGEKSLQLAPSDSYAIAIQADRLIESGRVEEGIAALKKAIRLCPFPPPWFLFLLGTGFHINGENESAVLAFRQAIEREPGSYLTFIWLASALVDLGKPDDARSAAKAALELEPHFSAETWSQSFKSTAHSRIKGNLISAGLPG
jgi:TolB-like protein/class 3 adenylate cyclase/Tfp pilus assembly protein PilF